MIDLRPCQHDDGYIDWLKKMRELNTRLTSRLKIANRSYYHSGPVLWNNLPSHLRQVDHHVTTSPILNSPVSDLSTSLFTLPFFLSLYSPRLSQD